MKSKWGIDAVILWTIQNEEVLEKLQKEGVYHANEDYLFCRDIPSIEYVYDWLSAKMTDKVGAPPSSVRYPVWAWHTWEGKREKRNLRGKGFGNKGERLVQLEIEVPDGEVVLSDFHLWVAVMNLWNLNIRSEDDAEELYKRLREKGFELCDSLFFLEDKRVVIEDPELEALKKEVIKSWDQCFEIDAPYNDYFEGPEKSIQATFWELKIEQIRKIWHFKCR